MPTRREFIAGTAAAAFAAALNPLSLAQQASAAAPEAAAPVPAGDGKKLGWALVGIGSLTKNQIIPALAKAQKSKLVALVTGHPYKAPPIVERYGLDPANVYSYENYDKLADNPAVDVIYIVLPNGMHAEYTKRGFKAGKHILCEKPMANTSVECQQMIDAGKAAGKKLMIAYRIRREPTTMAAIEMYRSRQFGEPKLIVADHGFNIAPNVWRLDKKLAGGGALFDIGIYSLNATRYLSGEEPESVTAQQTDNPHDPRFKQIEESMVWTTRFPSGVLATCTTSYNIAGANHIRVVFDKGIIDMEPATSYHGIKLRAPKPTSPPMQFPDIDQFTAQVDYFSDCVMNNQEPITTGEEGLKDLKIIEAIYESARTGKTVKLA